MAKEVLNSWNEAFDLVMELIAPGYDDPEHTTSKYGNFLTEGKGKRVAGNFWLQDANGKEVAFPVRLMFDATIRET